MAVLHESEQLSNVQRTDGLGVTTRTFCRLLCILATLMEAEVGVSCNLVVLAPANCRSICSRNMVN